MSLSFDKFIPLPKHAQGGFDHADVFSENGWVYVAHTANGSVEVFNGVSGSLVKTVPGCPEASGVVCAQREGLVFAASRGTGNILTLNARKGTMLKSTMVGSKPNGLAWCGDEGVLLVADVADNNARLYDPDDGRVLHTIRLPGRPRWCSYAMWRESFIIAVREPSGFVTLNPKTGALSELKPVSAQGAHGLEVDEAANRAYIGCDAGRLVVVDLETLTEKGSVPMPKNVDVLWFNPKHSMLYAASGKPGTIVAYDTLSLKQAQVLRTEEGAGTLTFDQQRQRLYSFQPRSCRAGAWYQKQPVR